MQTSVDNLLSRSPARYGAAPVASEAEWSYERAKHERLLSAGDISEVAYDKSVLAAVKSGDAALVGRVLLAAVNAYLDRLADRSIDADPRERTSEDAAAEALQADLTPLLRASIARVAS